MKKKIVNFFRLFLPIILGSIVGFLIKDYIDFKTLNKPPLAPSGVLFPIIWSILYLLMGISYYLYRKDGDDSLVILYYVQLAFNLLWSIIFFILKWRFVSIIWILILVILVYALLEGFKKDYKISFYLNIPYIIWCIFATYLNIGIFLLN